MPLGNVGMWRESAGVPGPSFVFRYELERGDFSSEITERQLLDIISKGTPTVSVVRRVSSMIR